MVVPVLSEVDILVEPALRDRRVMRGGPLPRA